MDLTMAREKSLGHNLFSLPNQEKQTIMGSLFDLLQSKELFWEAVTAMQQASNLSKK